MGLGPVNAVTLLEARERASAQRTALLDGLDPIHARDQEQRAKAAEAAKAVTFKQSATAHIASHRAAWKNAKHSEQWESTLETYAYPVIGDLAVQDVETAHVLKILEPIWTNKHETATRVRGRIECILDDAKARGNRTGENPARWKGHLKQILPSIAKKSRVKHHAALPFSAVGALVERLRELPDVAARMLEFTILTAARTGEVTAARPEEFELNSATWTVPAARMKAGKEHRVPLSPRAVDIVRDMLERKGQFVFPARRPGHQLDNMTMLNLLDKLGVSATVHGFRSSFRDWAAERTAFPHEVCEMALAHTIQNAAEAAYRRGDLFEKRRKLMEAWADYIDSPQQAGEVVPLRSAA